MLGAGRQLKIALDRQLSRIEPKFFKQRSHSGARGYFSRLAVEIDFHALLAPRRPNDHWSRINASRNDPPLTFTNPPVWPLPDAFKVELYGST